MPPRWRFHLGCQGAPQELPPAYPHEYRHDRDVAREQRGRLTQEIRGLIEQSDVSRRREIRDAATLLRLGLAYGPGGMSLREVTAWAQLHDVATLSDVALL